MPSTKPLTTLQRRVQERLARGEKVRTIAEDLGVSTQRVYRIKAIIERSETPSVRSR